MTIYVGLTGSISCGKSTVCKILEKQGCIIVDADKIAKKALEPGQSPYETIKTYFEKEYHDKVNILNTDKTINRDLLGSITFKDPKVRSKVNDATHRWIFWEISKELYNQWSFWSNDKIVILDAPLLFETKIFTYFTKCNIVVTTSDEKQLEWLMKRNNFSEEEAKNRINSQMPQSEKIKLADYIIKNDSDLENLEKQTIEILNMIKGKTMSSKI